MDNGNEYIYGSANRMLRTAMREYGIEFSGSHSDDQFGWADALAKVGASLAGFVKDNPEVVIEVGAAIVETTSNAKKTEAKGRSITRKAKKATKTATKYDEAMVGKISQYIGEYTTMLGEMRRQLTENGIIDANAQNEVARNAFAAELYDNPPADLIKKNVLKSLVIRMDKNLKRAYDSKSQVRVS